MQASAVQDSGPQGAAAESKDRFGLLLVAVFILALAARLHFIAATDFGAVIRGDAVENVSYAYNLVNKGVFSSARPDALVAPPDSYRGPGYPAFLAVAVAASGDSLSWMGWVRALQGMLGAMTAVLAMMLARRMMSTGMAAACGIVVAMWPPLITINGYFLTETLAGFSLMLALVVGNAALSGKSLGLLVLAGLLWGAAYLINPVFLFAPLIFLPAIMRGDWRGAAIFFLLAAFVLPAAWAVRSGAIEESGKSAGGRAVSNFVQGSWPDYHAAYQSRNAAEEPARIMAEIAREDELMHTDRGAGLRQILGRMANQPGRYAWWYLVDKPFLLWDWAIRIGAGDIYVYPAEHSPFERPGLLASVKQAARNLNGPLFLGAVGCIAWLAIARLCRRTPPTASPAALVAWVFVYLTVVHVVLQAEPRYSIPYRPLEFILAFLLLAMFSEWVKARFRRAHAGGPQGHGAL